MLLQYWNYTCKIGVSYYEWVCIIVDHGAASENKTKQETPYGSEAEH